jgi:integrase
MAVNVREKKKGSGEWWIFINHKGKRRSKKIGSKTGANAVKREVEARIANGDLGMLKAECPTLAQYGKQWLSSPLHDWSRRTYKEYDSAFRNHVLPVLGHLDITDIRVRDIKDMLARIKSKGLSPATARAALKVVSSIFEEAREDDLVQHNPCVKMGKKCGTGGKVKNPLMAEEVERLLHNSKSLALVLQVLFLLLVRTGLRIGEALALQWSDIDLDNAVLSVSTSYDYKHNEIKATKTCTTRTVMLTKQTVQGLKSLAESTITGGYVFPGGDNEPLGYDYVNKWFREIRPREVTLHDLRHTYATLRLAKGDNLIDVSKQLGHKDATTTLRHYADWMPQDDYRHQINELDSIHLPAPYTHPTTEKSHGYH